MNEILPKPRYTHPKRNASPTIVRTFDLFRGLESKDQARIAAMMHMRRFEVGNYIISADQPGTEVYFLISGRVRVCAFSANGKQVHFEDLEAGNLFGELAAIDEEKRSSDCIALEAVTLSIMTRDDFLNVAQQYPTVLNALLRRLTGMVRRQMKRVYEFTSCNVSQRVRFEILRIAANVEQDSERINESVQIISPPTHAEIATRISTHREAVTRELKNLEALGVIEWRRGSHYIHDMKALVELASREL